MERIKDALEKAKQNRASASAKAVHASSPQIDHEAARTQASGDDIVDLSYSQTQVIELNPAHLEKNRIVAFNKTMPMCWVFDLLRTQVLQKMEENGWRTLAVTSPTPEAGKSVISINLAMSIAQQTNKTAMLVDFDLRRPKVSQYLGLKVEKSLNDFFEDKAELADVLVNPGIPRLVVLAANAPIQGSSEMFSTKKVRDLISEFRDRYSERIVIFDLPPILNVDDTIAILPKIDCVLVVIANGGSTKSEIEESMHHLASSNLLGVVFNKAESKPNSYYY